MPIEIKCDAKGEGLGQVALLVGGDKDVLGHAVYEADGDAPDDHLQS